MPEMRERFKQIQPSGRTDSSYCLCAAPLSISMSLPILSSAWHLFPLSLLLLAMLSYLYGRTSSSSLWLVCLYCVLLAACFLFSWAYSQKKIQWWLCRSWCCMIISFISGFTFKGPKLRIAIGMSAATILLVVSMPFWSAFKCLKYLWKWTSRYRNTTGRQSMSTGPRCSISWPEFRVVVR